MNKTEFIRKLAIEVDIPLNEAKEILSIVVDALKNGLMEEDRIEIRGFGSFQIKNYKSYIGRNPKTEQQITVRPKRMPFFRAGKELKDLVNS
ncbi:MAG: integration host factor subunit beta [Desulfovibrionaceae bacterium]|nr:integration host factor subunit beta [Desulfovibrionaceae bacterium]